MITIGGFFSSVVHGLTHWFHSSNEGVKPEPSKKVFDNPAQHNLSEKIPLPMNTASLTADTLAGRCTPSSQPSSRKTETVFTEKLFNDLSQRDLDSACVQDYVSLSSRKEYIIAGYLNLGKECGWHEGGDPRLGNSFTRYILLNYVHQNKGHLGNNAIVLKKTVNAFKNAKRDEDSFSKCTKVENSLPKESRICYDASVIGWQRHAIGRLVGNLGTTYNQSKPFFEILVNSQGSFQDIFQSLLQGSFQNVFQCRPFSVSIYANGQAVEERRKKLGSLEEVPKDIACVSFYSSSLDKPDAFLKQHQAKLGPNSVRLLHSLFYLETVELTAQKVGNCWIKQPLRGLLPALYVELITNRSELTFSQAWNEAKNLYKHIQMDSAIPLVEDFIRRSRASPQMKKFAYEGLAVQKRNISTAADPVHSFH